MITLSIIIPSFGHAKFIKSTLDSHVENNPFEYEIVLIDDGSKDDSVAVINQWIKDHPKIKVTFVARENMGVTATLNQLLDLAKGKYIRLFGSDDNSIPGANAKLVEYLEKNQADAVFGYCQVIDENGAIIAENSIINLGRTVEEYQNHLSESIIKKWAIVGPSILLRKTVFDTIGKFNEKSLVEDWYLYLNLLGRLKLSFYPIPVAQYRHHQGNVSRTKDPAKRIKNYESQIMSGRQNLEFFKGRDRKFLEEAIWLLEMKKAFVSKNPPSLLKTMLRLGMSRIRG